MHYTKNAIKCIQILQGKGYEAYLVGGCVRDNLLGLIPKDEDITTNAKAEEVIKIFEDLGYSVLPTGIKHGTVSVMMGNPYEITTYRKDGDYSDHRRPDEVEFTSSIEEDLARRDFTMNAIAYDPISDKFVDPFNGLAAISSKQLKAVNNPVQRFEEDALRMMRAVRFVAQKGFEMDESVYRAILKKRGELMYVSMERIHDEFMKILMSEHVIEGLDLLHKTGLMKQISPEMNAMYETTQENPYHCYTVGGHTSHVVAACRRDAILRTAAFFHDIGKPAVKSYGFDGVAHFYDHPVESRKIAERLMKQMRFPSRIMDPALDLIYLHDYNFQPKRTSIAKFIYKHQKVTVDNVHRLFELQRADILGQAPDPAPRIAFVDEVESVFNEVVSGPYQISDLAINGFDIKAIEKDKKGNPVKLEGREILSAKNFLLSQVLMHPEFNTKEKLIDLVKGNVKTIKNGV